MVVMVLKLCLFAFLSGLLLLLINSIIMAVADSADCSDKTYDVILGIECCIIVLLGLAIITAAVIGLICLFKALFC